MPETIVSATLPAGEKELSIDELMALPLAEYISYMQRRTPEQIQTARERLLAGTPEPLPLPAGQTLEDVIVGAIDFEQSKQEIAQILKEQS